MESAEGERATTKPSTNSLVVLSLPPRIQSVGKKVVDSPAWMVLLSLRKGLQKALNKGLEKT